MDIQVKVLLSRGMELPAYATEGSAAVDLRAAVEADAPVTIAPGERALIPTGMAISPEARDVVAIVAARSGLAIKKGICLANGLGEICVGLYNTSKEPFMVNRGDRIAQLMFMPVYAARLCEVASLDETERGADGFGSTGVK